MEKNALVDMDMWKEQITEMIKSHTSDARVAIKNYLSGEGKPTEVKDIFEFVKLSSVSLLLTIKPNNSALIVSLVEKFPAVGRLNTHSRISIKFNTLYFLSPTTSACSVSLPTINV